MLTVRPRPARSALAVAVLIALGAAGCGSGDDTPTRPTTTTTASAAAPAPTTTASTPAPATTATTPADGGTVPMTGDGGAYRSVLPTGWESRIASRPDLPDGASYYQRGGDVLAVLPGSRVPGGVEAQARTLGSGSQLPPGAYAGRARTTVDGERAVVLSFPISEGGRELRQTMVLVSHARRSYVLTFATGDGGSARVPDVLRRVLAAWRWT